MLAITTSCTNDAPPSQTSVTAATAVAAPARAAAPVPSQTLVWGRQCTGATRCLLSLRDPRTKEHGGIVVKGQEAVALG